MRCGIIDIGSNTIRAVVYEVQNRDFRELLAEKDFSGIISYVKNGTLSEEGVLRIVEALTRMRAVCQIAQCEEVHCFATASLREVKNLDELLPRIEQAAGVKVRVISGEEEAYYDYLGLCSKVTARDGVGIDLGGGSCQVFHYRNSEVVGLASMRCGSLVLYENFVRGILPTEKEQRAIRRFVKEKLEKQGHLHALGYSTLYAMGGTARAAAKLYRAMAGGEGPIAGCTLTVRQLRDLEDISINLGTQGARLLSRVVPSRLNTMIPGVIALRTICKYVGARQIQVVKYGVREGYLWKNIVDRKR